MPIDSSVWPDIEPRKFTLCQIGEHQGGFATFVLRETPPGAAQKKASAAARNT